MSLVPLRRAHSECDVITLEMGRYKKGEADAVKFHCEEEVFVLPDEGELIWRSARISS